MRHLLTIAALVAAFHSHHYHRYWWPDTVTCIITVGQRHGVFIVGNVPDVTCYNIPAGYHDKPFPGYAI